MKNVLIWWVRSMKKSSFVKALTNNYGWIIGIGTIVTAVSFAVFKFIKFISMYTYFHFYKINPTFYNYNDINLVYDLVLSTFSLIVFYLICYNYFTIPQKLKEKKYGILIAEILMSLFFNVILFAEYGNKTKPLFAIIQIGVIIVGEIFVGYCVSRSFKTTAEESFSKTMFIDKIKSFVFSLFVLIFALVLNNMIYISQEKDFRIINKNLVILYSTSSHYIVADCKLENQGKTLIIMKEKQQRIPADNVKTEQMHFDKVK